MYHIFHDVEIHAFVEDIFYMISQADGLNSWWTVKSSGHANEDEEFQFYFSEEYDWRAKVLQIKNNESIHYQMIKADDDWKDTMLSFELIKKAEHRYLLRFEHRNWTEINAHFRQTCFCWALYLNTLKLNAEKKFRDQSQDPKASSEAL